MPVPGGLVIVSDTVDCGGSEQVLATVAQHHPDAPIVAAHFEAMPEPGSPESPAWTSRARLVRMPYRRRHFVAPWSARRMAGVELPPADVVLCFAHGGWSLAAQPPPGARLLCYTPGPPSALHGRRDLYLRDYAAPLRPLLRASVPALRAYGRQLMRRPHRILTTSRRSAAVIAREYGRQAEVVHPPVRTEFFTPGSGPRTHALAVGRLVPQKQFDLLLEAFRELPGERLVIAGWGPWLGRLKRMAPPNVRFAGWVSDEQLRELYRSSWALLCPSVEEFGIVMAEAHACGVPVVAPRDGGACEIVDDPATGVLLDEVTGPRVARAAGAVRRGGFDAGACRRSAERFSVARFVAELERALAAEQALATRAAPEAEPQARRADAIPA
jgi:glycosyltransferase involved in cell wall biosynthesis